MKQKEFTKLASLAVLPVIASVFGWVFLNQAFQQLQFELALPTLGTLWNFIASFLFLFLGLGSFGVIAALEPKFRVTQILSYILPLTLIVLLGFNAYTLIGAAIFAVGLMQFALKVQEERDERLKVSINKYMRYGLGLAISATLLAVSISFYGTTVTRGTDDMDPVDVLSRVASNGVNQALAIQLPGYNPNMTLDEFMLLLFATKFKEAKAAEVIETNNDSFFGVDVTDLVGGADGVSIENLQALLPPDFADRVKDDPSYIADILQQIQHEFVVQQLADARDQMLETLGIEAKGTDPVGSVVEQALHARLDGVFSPFKYLIPPILALTLYFALQIFGFLYGWITRLMAIIVFEILRISRFFKVEDEVKKAQIIRLN